MSQFEYLSVLISIIVGLGVSHLLSSAARLIQARRQVRFYLPTLLWMCFLLLLQIQVWWVAFERAEQTGWHFFLFVLYLLIPVGAFLLSYLIVPDLDAASGIDLRASYYQNRSWLYGILTALVLISLLDEAVENGAIPRDLDALFRVGFLGMATVGLLSRGPRLHFALSSALLAGFLGYILLLFLRLN